MSGSIDQQLQDKKARPPAELVETKQSVGAIARLMDKLPDNQQEVLRLKFQNELSYKEISRVTGLSVSNVGFQIHAAIAKLREEFQKAEAATSAVKGGAQ